MGISNDVIGDVIGRVIGVIKCKVDQDEQLPFYCCVTLPRRFRLGIVFGGEV